MVQLEPGKETICWAEGYAAERVATHFISLTRLLSLSPVKTTVVKQLRSY